MNILIRAGFYLGSAWSLFIVTLVVLGNEWALPRAAGGQFEAFPIWLRTIYFLNVILISAQIYVFFKARSEYLNFFLYLNIASAILNAISRSPLERWNALAAAASAFAIFFLKKKISTVVD